MVYQVAKTVAEKMREDKYKAHDNKTDHLKAYTATRQTMDDTWQGKEARCVETEQAVRDQERVVRGLRKIKEDALEMKNKLGAQSGESPPLKPLAPSSLKQRDEAADQRKVEKKQTLKKKERKEYQIPKKPSVKEAELMKRVAEIVASSPGVAEGVEGEEAEEEEGEGEGSLRGAKEGGKDTFRKEDTGKGMKDGWDKEEWMVEWEVDWEVDLVEVGRGSTRSRDTKVDTREVRPKE
ncbi:unnamed protein product [Ectocarpus sp. CCAP 1310/34]|nr:unnamed protein product [Ectocarpus sp. CCAP 1310/34]